MGAVELCFSGERCIFEFVKWCGRTTKIDAKRSDSLSRETNARRMYREDKEVSIGFWTAVPEAKSGRADGPNHVTRLLIWRRLLGKDIQLRHRDMSIWSRMSIWRWNTLLALA